MDKVAWFYKNNQRYLLVMNSKNDWKDMGSKAIVALQDKKLDDVGVVFTSKACEDQHGVGLFANSFLLANYQYSFKMKVEKVVEDPRMNKNIRRITNI